MFYIYATYLALSDFSSCKQVKKKKSWQNKKTSDVVVCMSKSQMAINVSLLKCMKMTCLITLWSGTVYMLSHGIGIKNTWILHKGQSISVMINKCVSILCMQYLLCKLQLQFLFKEKVKSMWCGTWLMCLLNLPACHLWGQVCFVLDWSFSFFIAYLAYFKFRALFFVASFVDFRMSYYSFIFLAFVHSIFQL